MSEPLYSIGLTAQVLPTSGAISVGDALVYNSSLGAYVVATAANRAAADSRACAIALTPRGGSPLGTTTFQASGPLATAISGLDPTTPGTYELVRVSTAGRLERISSYTTGDDVVGYAYPDGRVALHIGIPWGSISASGGAALPANAVQASKSDGTFLAAANASISSDGNAQFGASPFPALGTNRYAKDSSAYVRNHADSRNVLLWGHTDYSGTTPNFTDGILYGGSGSLAATDMEFRSRYYSVLTAEGVSGTDLAHVGVWSKQAYNSVDSVAAYVDPSLIINPVVPFTTDYARGGRGYLVFRYRETAHTGSFPAGYTGVYADSSTGHLSQVLPDGTVFDLTTGTSVPGSNDQLLTSDGAGALIAETSTLNTSLNLSVPLGGNAVALTFKAANISLTTSADVTLSSSQYECPRLVVTDTSGAAAGTYSFIFPATVGAIWIIDTLSGWDAYIKTSGGAQTTIASNTVTLVYCDGTNFKKVAFA